MKSIVTVFCVVTAVSILLFEITPTSDLWSTERQQRQEAPFTCNALLIKNQASDGISAKPGEEHMVTYSKGAATRSGNINSVLAYPKQKSEYIVCFLTAIRKETVNTLSRMDIEEPLTVKNKEKLTHRAFRIHDKTFTHLQKEAAKRGISVSNFVNNILKNYVSYGMYFEQFAFIPVSKEFMRTIFVKIERDQDIEQCSRDLGTLVVNEFASNYFPNLNSETLIQFLELWFRRFQNCQHRVDVVEDNGKGALRHTFSVYHDINANFSVVLKRILSGLVEPITKSIVIFSEVTPSTITFSFEI